MHKSVLVGGTGIVLFLFWQSCSYAAHLSAGMERLAEGPLKNLNPDKLMKFAEKSELHFRPFVLASSTD